MVPWLAAMLVAVVGRADLLERSWNVDGVSRTALVRLPANLSAEAPLVFVFHGHGGSMRNAARSMPLHEVWPEAVVVYPQGLPTPGQLTDKEGRRTGWQASAGSQGDRDLKFFDAMLADLTQSQPINPRRIYATGHSNGGGFTYLLWAERGDVFAALAPSSALLARGFNQFKPKPVFHVASPSDPLVKFAWQEKMLEHVLRLNQCGPLRTDVMGATRYASKSGHEVVVFLHPDGHRYPTDAAPALIAKFFQDHVRP